MKFDGIIFDMDGVIVDVTKSYRETIRRTASYFLGREVKKMEVNAIKNKEGMNNDWDATFALINDRRYSYEEVKAYFQSVYLGNNGKKGLISNEKLLVSKKHLWELKIKCMKLGIATGRPREEAKYAITNNKLEGIFNCIVAMEDVKRDKPCPDSILKVMEILKIRNTVYIGDSPSDVLAAKAAGIPCIYIGNEKLGTLNFKSMSEVMKYLLKKG